MRNAVSNALRNALVNAPEPDQTPDTRHQIKCLHVTARTLAHSLPCLNYRPRDLEQRKEVESL